jgi:hypothetical protein
VVLTLSGATVVMVNSFLDLSSEKPAVGWLLGFALPLPFAFPLSFALFVVILAYLASFDCSQNRRRYLFAPGFVACLMLKSFDFSRVSVISFQ